MGRNKLSRTVCVAAAALLGGAGAVWGGETDRGGYELALSTKTPGAVTGLKFHVLYKNPDDPEAKPPAVTAAVFELPGGLRIDDDALPQCTASDEDFRAQGRDACPPETQVGEGKLTAMTGVPGADPVTADVTAFNGDGEIVEVVFFEGTNVVAGMDRLTIEDGRLVAHPPATPGGPPDGRTAVRELRLELPPKTGASGRSYATSPPDCPTGTWVSRARYEFEDGGQTAVTSEIPCTRDADATGRPAIRVRVRPSRARTGERTTFRVRARSTDRDCVQRARVRLGGRRKRTGPKGRARVRIAFDRAGRKRVVVAKAGCRRGTARVRVIDGS